jgi:hypothetical protein
MSDAGHAAAFDFLRLVRDPDFRTLLNSLGYEPGQNIAMATDDEPFLAVLSRIIENGMAPPCLIVIPHPQERFGYRFMLIGPSLIPHARREAARLPHPKGSQAASSTR